MPRRAALSPADAAALAQWQQGGKPSKYRNVKTTVDGIVFDSAKEAKRWQELLLLEKIGDIHGLQRQPPFALHVMNLDDKSLRVVGRFTPDFQYRLRDSTRIIEDVKSPSTRKETAYRLRKRMFEAEYGLTISEV